MYISGSISTIKAILKIAHHLRADAIQFFAPNKVLIIAKNKEDYVFTKTTLFIGYSVFVPKALYLNMHLYLKAAQKAKTNRRSMFYQETVTTVLFSPNAIMYNDSPKLVQSMKNESLRLEKEMELKFEQSIQTSYNSDAPYLRLSETNTQKLHQEMSKFKKQYSNTHYVSDNEIHLSDEGLVWLFKHRQQNVRIETGIDQFAAHPRCFQEPVIFADKAFYLFRWLMKLTSIDEVVFLPRNDYCILEGHMSEMITKVRMKLRGDRIGLSSH